MNNTVKDSFESPKLVTGKGEEMEGEEMEKPARKTNSGNSIAKRANKHSPVEVTSKRPVSRRRTIIEVKHQRPRDPRFLPMTGQFSVQKFQSQYGFLRDLHSEELETLRTALKQAKKLLASSPQDLRLDREQEVNRLALAVKRAESTLNKDRQEKVEREAIEEKTKEEREKRKQGKGSWWMKQADKKSAFDAGKVRIIGCFRRHNSCQEGD